MSESQQGLPWQLRDPKNDDTAPDVDANRDLFADDHRAVDEAKNPTAKADSPTPESRAESGHSISKSTESVLLLGESCSSVESNTMTVALTSSEILADGTNNPKRTERRASRRGRHVSPDAIARSRIRGARRRVVQALYAFQLSPTDRATLLADFRLDAEHAKVDDAYFERLLMLTLDHRSSHDESIERVAGREAGAIDPVERAVLWLAIEELQSQLTLPAAVVVAEALSIVAQFGADQSHRFVHAVLEHVSRASRPHETAERGPLPTINAPEPLSLPADLDVGGATRLAEAFEKGALVSADGNSAVTVRRAEKASRPPEAEQRARLARASPAAKPGSIASGARMRAGDVRGPRLPTDARDGTRKKVRRLPSDRGRRTRPVDENEHGRKPFDGGPRLGKGPTRDRSVPKAGGSRLRTDRRESLPDQQQKGRLPRDGQSFVRERTRTGRDVTRGAVDVDQRTSGTSGRRGGETRSDGVPRPWKAPDATVERPQSGKTPGEGADLTSPGAKEPKPRQ